MAYREAHGDELPPDRPRWVHIGRFDVYVDESGRLATEPAPTRETVRAEQLAPALKEFQRDPVQALAALERLVKGAKAATQSAEELVELGKDLANLADPATAAKRAEPIVARIVHDYREGRFRDVARLVGAVLSIYLLYERWRALVALLHLDRLSAQELGNTVEAAAAGADLDKLGEASGFAPPAEEVPQETAGQVAQVAPHAGVPLAAKAAAAVAGALLVAGGATGFAVGGGGWYGLGGGDEEVRAGGDAEVIAFAVRTDASAAGTEDERAGWSAPRDAVDPGDDVEVCEPLFLYAFVTFDGMKPGTEWSVVASNPAQADISESGTWSSGPSYTMQFFAERPGQAIPYGSWTFVATIGEDDVDEADVTLVEAC